MKKIKSILTIKRLLTIAFIGISAFGFSQTTDANADGEENSKEVIFDFMGIDLSTQSPPQLNGWKNLSGNSQMPELKSAEFNHSRLDSIVGMTNYGPYIESWDWQFTYDENNKLATSVQHFYDTFNAFRNKTELRKYDENGQMLSLVRTERTYLNVAFVASYKEVNQYANGNMIKQIKIEISLNNNSDLGGVSPKTTETTFTYNEKNQRTKAAAVITSMGSGSNSSVSKNATLYLYDQEDRLKYTMYSPNSIYFYTTAKYEYITTDSTLLIKQSRGLGPLYVTPADLEKYGWKDYLTYRISLDQYGRTKSIEKTFSQNGSIIFNAEYDYIPSGKLRQIILTSDDTKDLPTNYGRTIIRNTYEKQDNLMKYERMFYNSVTEEWVYEELKTYYYSSIKTELTSNNQHKTDDLYIYPNPASDIIYLSASPEPGSSYTIYNLMGESVSQGMLKSQSIPVSQLKPGIYFLKIAVNNVASVFRFIKK